MHQGTFIQPNTQQGDAEFIVDKAQERIERQKNDGSESHARELEVDDEIFE